MNRKSFYASLRKRDSGVFGTSLSQGQVEGCEAILDECVERGADLGQTAYILATAYGESDRKMQPCEENLRYSAKRIPQVFSKKRLQGKTPGQLAGKPELLANTVYGGEWGANHLGNVEPGDGWRFRGQGIGQITGRRNFTLWGKHLGMNLVQRPDLLMHLEVSVEALVRPMLDGWATGKRLGDYVNGDKRHYRNARQVWNHGSSDPDKYAAYAKAFEAALEAAGYAPYAEWHMEPAQRPSDAPPAPKADEVPKAENGLWAAVLGLLRALGLVK